MEQERKAGLEVGVTKEWHFELAGESVDGMILGYPAFKHTIAYMELGKFSTTQKCVSS
jgi:hypothetical protein